MVKHPGRLLIHALRMRAKRGKLAIAGKQAGAIVWDTC
jgi:hypothetical protein